jgi:hypothetical protein
MAVRRVGPVSGYALPDFAVTVGPFLDASDFEAHPVNQDPSLGGSPSFADQRRVRMAIYHGLDKRAHICLFDGRSGSFSFQGATPTEVRRLIAADPGYRWGCFLDRGQTAKMWVTENGITKSCGNRHYLRWPTDDSGEFVWVPDIGRPVPSVITLRGRETPRPRAAEAVEIDSSPRAGSRPEPEHDAPPHPPAAPSTELDYGPGL